MILLNTSLNNIFGSHVYSIKLIYGKNYKMYEIDFYGKELGNSIPFSIDFFKEPISGKLLKSWI